MRVIEIYNNIPTRTKIVGGAILVLLGLVVIISVVIYSTRKPEPVTEWNSAGVIKTDITNLEPLIGKDRYEKVASELKNIDVDITKSSLQNGTYKVDSNSTSFIIDSSEKNTSYLVTILVANDTGHELTYVECAPQSNQIGIASECFVPSGEEEHINEE